MPDFFKYHALGNDYIVIDPAVSDFPVTEKLAAALCARHTGAGGDGVLYGPFFNANGLPEVKIFNADGSEAEKSGNGIRIFAKYLRDRAIADADSFVIATLSGETPVAIGPDDIVSADMGAPSFNSADVPASGPAREIISEPVELDGETFRVTALSVGIPHCVVFLDEISPELARRFGPLLETHVMFPRKTNVQFARRIAADKLEIQIWERGSGYTLASGSSSCAAMAAGRRLGLLEDKVSVTMPGGAVTVTAGGNGRLTLSGPVTPVFSGEFSPEFKSALDRLC
ncbi:MAG: diaminopimelate epimerase [Elusimicrobiaceae bacterium]|nr:diaminopimelate epimerase [Elusimicrobiaceae bacterium]